MNLTCTWRGASCHIDSNTSPGVYASVSECERRSCCCRTWNLSYVAADSGICCYRPGATVSPLQECTTDIDGRLQSCAGPQTALADLIHLPSIVNVLLGTLALSDLAHLSVSSKACAAVLRPDKIKLDINRRFEVPALRCLFRLGCLDQLHEATVCVKHAYVDAAAGSYLGILGMCPRLRQLFLDYTVSYKSLEKDDSSFRGLVVGLPIHLTRTVHLAGIDSAAAETQPAVAASASAAAFAFAQRRLQGQVPPSCVKHFDRSWQPTEIAILPVNYW